MANKKRYPGHIERHGRFFRLTLSLNGKRWRFRARTKAEAERIARTEYDRLSALEFSGSEGSMPISVLFSAFEVSAIPEKNTPGTRRAYLNSLKVLRRFFVEELGDPLADTIKPKEVAAFKAWRRDHSLRGNEKIQNRTIQKDRTVLHTVFEHGRTLELVQVNPVNKETKIQAEKREPVVLSHSELERLLGACEDPMLRTYVLVLAETGLRCESEALWLAWEAIDLQGGYLFVDTQRRGGKGQRTKSGKTRYVPLTPRVRQALGDHMATFRLRHYAGQRVPWLFHHVTNKRNAMAGDRITTLRYEVNRAVKKAGLPPDFHQHDLRHRRVTTWLEEGKPVQAVQAAMGHSNINTTMLYYRFLKGHLRVLVEDPPSTPEPGEMVR